MNKEQMTGGRKLSKYNLFMKKYLNANLKPGMTKLQRQKVMRDGAAEWSSYKKKNGMTEVTTKPRSSRRSRTRSKSRKSRNTRSRSRKSRSTRSKSRKSRSTRSRSRKSRSTRSRSRKSRSTGSSRRGGSSSADLQRMMAMKFFFENKKLQKQLDEQQ